MILRQGKRKPDARNATFCSGFWSIRGNAKRPLEHYQEMLPKTLHLLRGQNLVFFYGEEDILDLVRSHHATGQLLPIRTEIEELPAYGLSEDYFESCKRQDNDRLRRLEKGNEKGLIHYEREYRQSGEQAYRRIVTIWMSKLLLVERVMAENPFASEFFGWADASVARFNDKRTNWNFMNGRYANGHLYHYGNQMRYEGELCRLNASFMFGHRDAVSRVVDLYRSQLDASRRSDYAHDEETILNLVYRDNERLFRKIGDPTRRARSRSRVQRILRRAVRRGGRLLKGLGFHGSITDPSNP